jgi:hypothetical protein
MVWFVDFPQDNHRFGFQKLYLSFIRPQLEYGDVVWDPHNKFLVNILENSSN